jgi:hypothetical protein
MRMLICSGGLLSIALIIGCTLPVQSVQSVQSVQPVQPTRPPLSWHNDGAAIGDFNIESGKCQTQAFGVSGLDSNQSLMVFIGCMRSKGWVFR